MKKHSRQELSVWLMDFMRREYLSTTQRQRLEQIRGVLDDTLSRNDHKVSLLTGSIRLTDGDGKSTGAFSEEDEFIRINANIWPLSRMQTAPPLLESQVKIDSERIL